MLETALQVFAYWTVSPKKGGSVVKDGAGDRGRADQRTARGGSTCRGCRFCACDAQIHAWITSMIAMF